MGLFKKKKTQQQEIEKPKKKKKERGPQYTNSLVNTPVLNYQEYYFSKRETIIYNTLVFVAGAVIAYIMYGGIGSKEDGSPSLLTHILNIVICGGIGVLAVKFFIPVIREKLRSNRRNTLRAQFMDLLDSLAASVASGNNAVKSFEAAQNDLAMQYGEESFIYDELNLLLEAQRNFIDIDLMLTDFGKRSGIKEIESFARVYALSYRKGGDFGKIIRDSYDILYNKINTEMEIETKVASTKNELNIMLAMPVLLVGMMKLSGGDFAANLRSASGVLGTTIGLAIVAGAYFIGRKITDIEV
ncbi:MAG: type II secretion system F family protein [Ruminococcus sp.]|nr:type II secretion system F family protein [Ruminococcus sp.]